MAIVQHPTRKYKTRFGEERCFVVDCDSCGKRSDKIGTEPGDAASAARKAGFQTIKGPGLGSPFRWWCGKCVR